MATAKPLPPDRTAELLGDVPRLSVREAIAGKLAALIATGVLAVGDELPGERELAAALSVSRETIRGAIQILAGHGILRVSHGARTAVAKADVGPLARGIAGRMPAGNYDLEAVHDARLLVERQVVGSAALRITDADLAALHASLAAQGRCRDDPVRFLLCDREFHGTIYRAGGNPLLADMAMDLYTYQLDHRRRIVARDHAIAASIADHRAIVAALERRDADAATCAFARHEMRIYLTTKDFLQKRGPASG